MQNQAEGAEISYIPSTLRHASYPVTNIPQQSDTFVTIDEPTLTYHNHSESVVYITIYYQCCTFYGLGKMRNGIYHHYGIIKNISTALTIPFALPIHPIPTPGNH